MNPQVAGVLRILIASLLAGLVTKGIVSPEQSSALVEALIGMAGIVGVAAWSWISNSLTALLTHVAKAPEVKGVVVKSDALADAIPSDKVVGPAP